MYGLPLFLYGIGIVLILSGIVWAALKHRARSLQVPRSVSAKNELRDTPPLSSEVDDGGRSTISRRGVGALFSSDEELDMTRRGIPRNGWVSRSFLLGITELGFAILLYAGLVGAYNSSVYMRLWVHSSLPFAEFLFNYYAVAGVAVLAIVMAVSVLLRNRQKRQIRM